MDLRDWITADLRSVRDRLARGVVGAIPIERWRERDGAGAVAPVSVAWHVARHHDVAINALVRGVPEVLDSWRDRVGVEGDTWRGLAEQEDPELVDELVPAGVAEYLLAVFDASIDWLTSDPLPDLTHLPDSAAALDALGAPRDRFGWLYAMWADKPVEFHLRWEAVGHGYNHLGELVAIRNRMGCSPF